MKAIVSDIHGNYEALQVALGLMAEMGISDEDIFCLGDVIGYGPQPAECLKESHRFAWNIQGNHEAALITGGARFNPRAQEAIKWTMDQLEFEEKLWLTTEWDTIVNDEETGLTYVHGSPRNHTEDYILPARAHKADFMEPIFEMIQRACFIGHTHIPGVFRENLTFEHPLEMGGEIDLSGEEGKIFLNVGSVGQPRDQNVQGCFVTLDGDKVTWHRFQYDLEKVVQMIYDIELLDNQLGDRLKIGH